MRRVAYHIGFWSLYVIFTVALYYVQEPNLEMHFVYEMVSLPAKIFAVYFTLYVILPEYLLKKKYGQAAILFVLTISLGILLLRLAVVQAVYPLYFPSATNGFFPDNIAKLMSPLLDLVVVTTLAVVFKLLKSHEKKEKDRLSLERSNLENELQLLKSQLQPHFLFNTLNGLYAQIEKDPAAASDMVIRLSGLLRYIIYEGRKPLVNIDDDIDCIENYIELERVRYGSKLRLQFEVTGETENKKVPPLLLLPFIENSFKHGVSPDHGSSWIRCLISITGNLIEMDLKNSLVKLPGKTIKSPGIGNKNINQLLEYNFPAQHSLVTKVTDEVYHVNLKIPVNQ